ncbi:FAD-dependent monooxygenase [Streptomyces sp. NPDC006134]|uniref:FAD-dependent monooxygenase n=1 Tax=Streptomyces sp. NPDC006134 TaxID=3154467 RepID=UPI0033E22676
MDTDVIVVGAGPTGLMLAGELRLGGARVVVLERLARPTGQSRGLGFTARAMEVFDQRGLLPRFGRGPTLETSPVGHFGGVRFDYSVLEGAHFGARDIPQSQTEAVLERWATELGADIRRGWEFQGLDLGPGLDPDVGPGLIPGLVPGAGPGLIPGLAPGASPGTDAGRRGEAGKSAGKEARRDAGKEAGKDAGVTVTARTPDGVRRLRAVYLVGCDGGHSAVRRAAGIDFPGTPATREMFLADVAGCALRPRPLGERLPHGMVMAAPLGDGVDRIIVCPHGTPPRDRAGRITFAEVADAWQRITGEDIHGGTAVWVSSFTDATRQAAAYRRGPVLLAGDAAHIHLPAGGQGLSTGVQDAVNLGWKLAATVRGTAADGLLDTYHAERHPVGARLLSHTRAQGTVFLGGAEADPLRDLLTGLLAHDDVKRHLAGQVSGLDIRYDLATGDHPLLGRRLAPRRLVGETGESDTTSLLHPGRGVLLDLADDPALRAAAAGWQDRVSVVTAVPKPVDGADELAGTAALLVRPDGHVAWTAPGTRVPAGPAGALRRWFGPPAPGHHSDLPAKET